MHKYCHPGKELVHELEGIQVPALYNFINTDDEVGITRSLKRASRMDTNFMVITQKHYWEFFASGNQATVLRDGQVLGSVRIVDFLDVTFGCPPRC